MKSKFEDWMIRYERKKKNTAYQYAMSIDKISRHYSDENNAPTDIFSLTNLEKIKSISEDYAQGGKNSSFGDKGKGTIRNSIATYLRYFQQSNSNVLVNEDTETKGYSEIEEKPNDITSFTYERDLQNALIYDVQHLFPEYKIFGSSLEGVEYQIEGKFIDVLLEHEENKSLKVIELKAGVANYKAFGQISMYIGLLTKKFPDRKISGVIIAGAIDESLVYACLTTNQVNLKTYQMKLDLDNA